jgi:hypothetical protein
MIQDQGRDRRRMREGRPVLGDGTISYRQFGIVLARISVIRRDAAVQERIGAQIPQR